jgi:tetratricopeptide (TPR) repeat protein
MRHLALLFLFFTVDFSKNVAVMENAWMDGDRAALQSTIESFRTMQAAEPKARTAYALGYAEQRLAHTRGVPPDEQKTLLTDAAAQFEAVIKLEPKNGEAHALLASALGSLIGLEKMRGMTLGPRANEEMENALALEPNNPRVLLQAGLSAFHKPVEYGGGIDIAEPLLRRAVSIFAQEPSDRPWPNWGRFESHMFLGMLLDKAGKKESARSEYEAALAIAPQSPWARAILQTRSK